VKLSIANRKAKFDYEFLEIWIAGICLTGSEVKSVRDSKVSMVDSFCFFISDELWLKGMTITPGLNSFQHDPIRDRKLLLKRKELKKLKDKMDQGLTIVPIRIFSSERNLIKVEIALAKGKKSYDKRNAIKEREAEREIRKLY
jgi:SsrA-binding protein